MSCGLTQGWLIGGQAAGGKTCRLMSSSRGATVCRQLGLSRGDISNDWRYWSVPAADKHCSNCRTEAALFFIFSLKAWCVRLPVPFNGTPVNNTCSHICWVNDLRNSRRSQRTEKAVLWEMNVTGKQQQPELIERPASLLVPTWASKPIYLKIYISLLYSHEMCNV